MSLLSRQEKIAVRKKQSRINRTWREVVVPWEEARDGTLQLAHIQANDIHTKAGCDGGERAYTRIFCNSFASLIKEIWNIPVGMEPYLHIDSGLACMAVQRRRVSVCSVDDETNKANECVFVGWTLADIMRPFATVDVRKDDVTAFRYLLKHVSPEDVEALKHECKEPATLSYVSTNLLLLVHIEKASKRKDTIVK